MRIAVCDDEKYFRDTVCDEINAFYQSLDVICLPFESGEEHYISPDDIIYAEADNNSVRFITAEREYQSRIKLAEAFVLLNGASDCFCRVHRSVVVNLAHIVSRREKEVKLDSGTILSVSKSYTAELKKRLMEYVRLNAR